MSNFINNPTVNVSAVDFQERIDKIAPKISWFNLVPFCIFVFAPLVYFRPNVAPTTLNAVSSAVATQILAAQSDPMMLILRGIAYLLAFCLFVIKLHDGLRFSARQVSFFALAAYMFASMHWSSYPIKVFINFGHLLGMGLILVPVVKYFECRPGSFYKFLSWVTGIFVLLSIPVALLLPAGAGVDGRWCGVAGNANTLGMICLVSLWANGASLFTTKEKRARRWNWFLLCTTLIALVGSGSMTSIVTAMFALTLFVSIQSIRKDKISVCIMKVTCALWCLILAVSIVYVLDPSLLGAESVFQVMGRSTNFSGRSKLWESAWPLVNAKPWFGWSFDSNMSVLKSLGGVGQFHNGYLDLLVRGGWIGMALFLMIIVAIGKRLLRIRNTELNHVVIYTVLVAAILLHNVTESSILRETHLLWVLLLFIYLFLDRLRLCPQSSKTGCWDDVSDEYQCCRLRKTNEKSFAYTASRATLP